MHAKGPERAAVHANGSSTAVRPVQRGVTLDNNRPESAAGAAQRCLCARAHRPAGSSTACSATLTHAASPKQAVRAAGEAGRAPAGRARAGGGADLQRAHRRRIGAAQRARRDNDRHLPRARPRCLTGAPFQAPACERCAPLTSLAWRRPGANRATQVSQTCRPPPPACTSARRADAWLGRSACRPQPMPWF